MARDLLLGHRRALPQSFEVPRWDAHGRGCPSSLPRVSRARQVCPAGSLHLSLLQCGVALLCASLVCEGGDPVPHSASQRVCTFVGLLLAPSDFLLCVPAFHSCSLLPSTTPRYRALWSRPGLLSGREGKPGSPEDQEGKRKSPAGVDR